MTMRYTNLLFTYLSQWVVLTEQSHALCRRQTKSLWVGEGFDLCNGAECVLTGPSYTAIRQWGLKMELFLHVGRRGQQRCG